MQLVIPQMAVHVASGRCHPSLGSYPCRVTMTVLPALDTVAAVVEIYVSTAYIDRHTQFMTLDGGRLLYRALLNEGYSIRKQA